MIRVKNVTYVTFALILMIELLIILQGPEGTEGGALTMGQEECELVFQIAHPTVTEELLEGERLAVDALDDCVGTEACCPGHAPLHHHANHGPSAALDDDDVVQTVGNGDGGCAVVGLEHKLAPEGVDDHGTEVEQ